MEKRKLVQVTLAAAVAQGNCPEVLLEGQHNDVVFLSRPYDNPNQLTPKVGQFVEKIPLNHSGIWSVLIYSCQIRRVSTSGTLGSGITITGDLIWENGFGYLSLSDLLMIPVCLLPVVGCLTFVFPRYMESKVSYILCYPSGGVTY